VPYFHEGNDVSVFVGHLKHRFAVRAPRADRHGYAQLGAAEQFNQRVFYGRGAARTSNDDPSTREPIV
jgi:hypothetical protein